MIRIVTVHSDSDVLQKEPWYYRINDQLQVRVITVSLACNGSELNNSCANEALG